MFYACAILVLSFVSFVLWCASLRTCLCFILLLLISVLRVCVCRLQVGFLLASLVLLIGVPSSSEKLSVMCHEQICSETLHFACHFVGPLVFHPK
jgi:hypothetical protein